MSNTDLGVPTQWRIRMRRYRVLYPLVVALLTLIILMAMWAWVGGEFSGIFASTFTLLAASVITLGYWNTRIGDRGLNATSAQFATESVTFFPVGARQKLSFYATYTAVAIFCGSAPLWVGSFDGYESSRYGLFVYMLPVVGPAVAVASLSYVFSRLVRGRREVGFGMGPSGIYLATWFGVVFFKWEWVRAAEPIRRHGYGIRFYVADPYDRPKGVDENWLTRTGWYRDRRYGDVVNCGLVKVDPMRVYQALQYYLRHANKRDELGAEAGLQRIRQGRFEDINKEINLHGDIIRS